MDFRPIAALESRQSKILSRRANTNYALGGEM